MKKEIPQTEIILFRTDDETVQIDVHFDEDTVWLTQEQMSELFEKRRSTITEHIQNIFKEGKLDKKVVCRKFRHATQHVDIKGKTQKVLLKYYNNKITI